MARKTGSRVKKRFPVCAPGEVIIHGKCYQLFLVAASGGIVKGANCNNLVFNVSEDFFENAGNLLQKKAKAPSSKKR